MQKNVILEDKEDYKILSNFIHIQKNEKIFKSKTTANILSKYNLKSEDVTF